MREKGLSLQGAAFYSHLLPCLDTQAWPKNRVAGEGWMAVGDAAGLVDPITGEGLYYAMRSADLAAEALVTCGDRAEATYREGVHKEFACDLEFGSRLARRVFRGKVFFGATPQRMVQFTRRSPRFRAVMQDLFAGTQNYTGLKQRLLDNLNGSLMEMAMSFGLRSLLPQNGLDD
jgi:flavin-dependent dehydrogenase